MVKHLRRLLYFPVLRNLREEEEYLAEIAEPAEEIINLNNQINLCETHIPFCGICAVCERKRSISQKSQKEIIKSE